MNCFSCSTVSSWVLETFWVYPMLTGLLFLLTGASWVSFHVHVCCFFDTF